MRHFEWKNSTPYPTFYCQKNIQAWCDFDGHHVWGVALLRQNKLRRYLTRPVTSTPDNSFSLWTSSTLYNCTSLGHYSWIKIPYLLGSPQCEKHVQIGLKHNIWVQLVAWLCPSQISLSLKWTAAAYSSSPINPSPSTHTFEESVVKYLSYNLFLVRRCRYQLSVTACRP